MLNNLAFYLFYRGAAVVLETGLGLGLYGEKDLVGVFLALKNIYRVIRMNSVYLLKNSPAGLLLLWESNPALCGKVNPGRNEKELLFEHLVNSCKADVFEALTGFFGYLLGAKRRAAEQPDKGVLTAEEAEQFGRRFAFCTKFGMLNVIGLPEVEAEVKRLAGQTREDVFAGLKTKMAEPAKNLKRMKEAGLFGDEEARVLEGQYKTALKLSLQLHGLAKTADLQKVKAEVRYHADLVTLEIN